MGSSNKKFLAPTAVPAGKSTGNVYRPTEIFKQGKGKGGGVGEHQPQARTLLQSAVSKCKIKNTNKQKAVSQLQRPPPTFAKKRKKEREKERRKERERERKKEKLTKTPHTQNLGRDCSSQFQSAKVSRLIAILGLRKLLKRDLIASTVQEKWGVRVSVSSRAQLALARARLLSPAPSSLLQPGLGVAALCGGSLSLSSL